MGRLTRLTQLDAHGDCYLPHSHGHGSTEGFFLLSWQGMWSGERGVAEAVSSPTAVVSTLCISQIDCMLFQQGSIFCFHRKITVSHVFLVGDSMDQWQERLLATWGLFLEG
jgi:hypothetical protein